MISTVGILLTAALVATAAAAAEEPNCDCYLTDGPAPACFKSHSFTDFRSLSQYATTLPAVATSIQGNTNANTTSPFFNWGTDFREFWAPQQYKSGDPAFPMIKTLNNLFINKNTEGGDAATYLRMRSTRLPGFQTAAEIQSNQRLDHASIRMYARVVGSSGACGSVFTYLHSDDPRLVQESDIEMLTGDDHGLLHYTNQPGVLDGQSVPGATHQIRLPDGKAWSDWTTHRLDWTPGNTTLFADGHEVLSSNFQVPRDDSFVLMNMWSDGGSWTGRMDSHGEAYMDVQWVEIVHGLTNQTSCPTVCKLAGPGNVVRW